MIELSKVTINEVDNTLFSTALATSDNIVFIPGVSTDGEENVARLFSTTTQFTNAMGLRPDADPNYMTAWDYAYNLLDQKMPVLFYRVVPSSDDIAAMKTANPDSTAEVAKAASHDLMGTTADSATDTKYGTISYKHVGTSGNNYQYMFVENSVGVYLKIYNYTNPNHTDLICIESLKVCGYNNETKMTDFAAGLVALKSKYVDITVDNPTKGCYFSNEKDPKTGNDVPTILTGGTDPDNESVAYVLAKDWDTNKAYNTLTDKFLTDAKFITSGVTPDTFITEAYTTTETNEAGETETVTHTPSDNKFPIATNAIRVAETRKDAIAILDAPIGTQLQDMKYFLVAGYTDGGSNIGFNSSYTSAYAPWGYMALATGDMWCPPSFIFLYSLAKSLKAGNSIWEVPAGINRATISNMIDSEYEVGQAVIDNWQKNNNQFINPIAKINQYGYVIWGNKTLYNPLPDANGNIVTSALSDISVRIVANEIKRVIFKACLELTFEKNILRTWNNFRSKVQPTLASMKDSNVIYGYQIILGASTISDEDIAQNRIRGVIRVSIARTAEDFDIDFILEPAGATFENDDQ